ncbi:Tar ligand binding domain-containing protein [Paracidovorax avenae]|uniref:Tar ligand binding domain-containing protein n=1 Tax=Paracidovorax avenae TaxID=80867 RepID=UPI001CEF9E87
MRNFKISTRLLWLLGGLSALLVAVGAVGLLGIARSNHALESMYRERLTAQIAIADLRYLTARNRQLVSGALLSPSPEKVEQALREARENVVLSDQLWSRIQALPLEPELREAVQRTGEQRRKIMQEGLGPALSALKDADIAAVRVLAVRKFDALYDPLDKSIASAVDLSRQFAEQDYALAVARFGTLRAVLGGRSQPECCWRRSSAWRWSAASPAPCGALPWWPMRWHGATSRSPSTCADWTKWPP